ncbi:MAG: hypothetical protein ABEK50_13105 [bacterium]
MSFIKRYSLKTLQSLCTSLIPETKELAEEFGSEQRRGAEATEVEHQVYEAFNNISEIDLGPLGEFVSNQPTVSTPLSPLIAIILDLTALEYILTGKHEDSLEVSLSSGPFTWLSERDRRATIDYLSERSSLQRLNESLESVSPYTGFLKYLVRGLTTVPLITYYSEWDGYEQEGGKWVPDPETFSGKVQGWEQSGFPGFQDGYPVFMGYEVEAFEENDY